MFGYLTSLKKCNIINFNTQNVTDVSFMFYRCLYLKELNLNSFNTDSIINMEDMLLDCSMELIYKIFSLNDNIKEEAFKPLGF